MISPASRYEPAHEIKIQEKRNERAAEERRMEWLKKKLKTLRQQRQIARAYVA